MGKCADETKRTEWRKRLGRFAGSGETVAMFCAAERVSVQTFYRWKRKLAREPEECEPRQASSPLSERRAGAFLPVRIEGTAEVEIELPNGTLVRVPGTDLGAIEAAIAAAGRVPGRIEAEAAQC
jgi:hypothetical protein